MNQVQQARPEQQSRPERMSVSTELLEKIGGYLATKPFAEVHELLGRLTQDAKPISNPEPQPIPTPAP
jgi:hypothetical protein